MLSGLSVAPLLEPCQLLRCRPFQSSHDLSVSKHWYDYGPLPGASSCSACPAGSASAGQGTASDVMMLSSIVFGTVQQPIGQEVTECGWQARRRAPPPANPGRTLRQVGATSVGFNVCSTAPSLSTTMKTRRCQSRSRIHIVRKLLINTNEEQRSDYELLIITLSLRSVQACKQFCRNANLRMSSMFLRSPSNRSSHRPERPSIYLFLHITLWLRHWLTSSSHQPSRQLSTWLSPTAETTGDDGKGGGRGVGVLRLPARIVLCGRWARDQFQPGRGPCPTYR